MGISQANMNKQKDTPLTFKGREQAKKLANRLRDEDISVIYSSDLKRAKQTAEEINKFHNVKINFDKRLRDMLHNENLEEFIKKLKSVFKDIEKGNRNVLVVSHGSSCLTLLAITTGNRKKGGKIVREHSKNHKNACVSLVENKGDKYKIRYIGCIKHLREQITKINSVYQIN